MPWWSAVSASSASASACCCAIVAVSAENVHRAGVPVLRARPLIQRLAGRGQRLQKHGADLGRQPPAESHHAVLVLIHVQRAARVLPGGFGRLGLAIYPSPASHDAFDMVRRAGASHRHQPLLGLRRGNAGQSSNLGVRELSTHQGLGQQWQRPKGARHPDAFAGRPQVEPHPPAQPGGAGAKSGVPALSGVELADEIEEAGGRGVEVGRQLGDLVTQPVE